MEKRSSLPQLPAQNAIGCTRCKLHTTRSNVVVGEGNLKADLVFVGEGPGYHEDKTGRPFVGRAGKLLDKMINAIGLKREDVYICNVVKCRPPNNRDPEADEVEACSPFLWSQLITIEPKVVVLTGLSAAKLFMGDSKLKMRDIRGNWMTRDGVPGQAIPIYHPAALLRNEKLKRPTWEDLQKVMAYLQSF